MPLPLAGRRWSQFLNGITFFIGIIVLVGWKLDIDTLKRPLAGLAAMNSMTALCLVLLSLSLFLVRHQQQTFHWSGYTLAGCVVVVAFLRLLGGASVISFEVDQLLFNDALRLEHFAGMSCRMSIDGAFTMLLLSASIFFINVENNNISQRIAGIAALIAWCSVIGYLYRVPEYNGALPYHPMAIHTAVSFIFLSMAIIISHPSKGIAKEFFSKSQTSAQARMLFPVILITPVILGYVRLLGHWSGMISTEFGVSLLVGSITIVVSLVAFLSIKNLNRREDEQKIYRAAQDALNKNLFNKNEEIHTLNEELTASNEELLAMNEQLHAAFDKIRQQSDIIVKQKDEQLNRVLDSSKDAIWSIDLTNRGENYISRSAEKLFGLTASGKMLTDPEFWENRIHHDDRHLHQQSLVELREIGSSECSYRMLSNNDNYLWVHQRSNLVYDDNKQAIRFEGIITDLTAYKKQESTLNEYRENLDIIFSSTVEGILLVDSAGKVILFNKAFEDFITSATGQKPETGKFIWEITLPERRNAAKELFGRALGGESIIREVDISLPTGNIVHEILYEPVVQEGEVKFVTVISIDITEKKKRERILKQSEARLRAIFESTDEAFTLLDTNYVVIMHNREARQIAVEGFGNGMNIFELTTPERREIFKAYLDKVRDGASNVKYDVEYKIRERTVWYHVTISAVRANGELVGYCITTSDFTAIKEAQRSIKESEERFRALIDNSKDVIVLVKENGRIAYVNPAISHILGYTVNEVLDLPINSLVNMDDEQNFENYFSKVRANQEKLIDISFRARHKNDGVMWLEGTATNLAHIPAVGGIVMNLRDITSRKTSEEERDNLVLQLIEKNNDLTQFSFIASHNLRGPVASLLGLFNLTKEEDLNPEQQTIFGMAKRSAHNLDNVIRDLTLTLEMRTHRIRDKEILNIRQIVEEIKKTLQDQIEQSHAEIIIEDSALTSFLMVKSYCYSILNNLISNAIRFRSPKRSPMITITTFANPISIGFTIQDNGLGIDLHMAKDRIFGLYQRFHLTSEGRGLGLYMVKTQVQLMNGKIRVESTPDVGSTFSVTFPYKQRD